MSRACDESCWTASPPVTSVFPAFVTSGILPEKRIFFQVFAPLISAIHTSLLFSFHVFMSVKTAVDRGYTVVLIAVLHVLVSTGISARDSRASGDVRSEKNPAKARPENRGRLPSRPTT